MISAYYGGANGVILIYDISDRKTFEHIEQWYLQLKKYVDRK